MGSAALSSSWFRSLVLLAPPERSALVPFAWVGGSLLDLYVGALVSVGVGLPHLRGPVGDSSPILAPWPPYA